jgi:hypothetical protein
MILTANISGWIAGGLKGAGLQSKYMLWGGLFLLGTATLAILMAITESHSARPKANRMFALQNPRDFVVDRDKSCDVSYRFLTDRPSAPPTAPPV